MTGEKRMVAGFATPAALNVAHRTAAPSSLSPATAPTSGRQRYLTRAPVQCVLRRRIASSDRSIPVLKDSNPEGSGGYTGKDENESENDGAEQSADSGSTGVPDTLPVDYARAVDGRGKDGCEQCDGVGSIVCPVCGGKGYISMTMMDTVSAAQCRMCRGRGAIPCPSCRDFIFKSVIWWDQIPSEDEDPDENWRTGPDGQPRVPWGGPPN